MIALSTGSLYTYGLARVFSLANEAGFDGIEVLIDHRWDSRDPAYLRQLSARFDLPIQVLHSPFVSGIAGWPEDQLGRLEQTVILAQELEVPTVVTHLPFRIHAISLQWYGSQSRSLFIPVFWPRKDAYYHALKNGRVAEMEAATGVTIGVENMPARRLFEQRFSAYWFNTAEALRQFPHVTLDTTHLGTWSIDPVAFYNQLKDRVAHVHLANFDGREHRLPFDGHLPLDQLLQAMAQEGYNGTITVEANPGATDPSDEAACLADLRRAVAFCREHFKKIGGRNDIPPS